MGYRLREGISFCVTGDQAVFIDTEQNRYFYLAPELREAFFGLIERRRLTESDKSSLTRMTAQGLLVPTSTNASPHPCPQTRIESSGIDAKVDWHAYAHLIPLAIWHFARAKRDLKRRSLRNIIQTLQTDKTPLSPRAHDVPNPLTAQAVSAAFAVVGIVMSLHNQCLPRSIATVRLLKSLGQPAELVFGVTINPFSAHCWAQQNTMVVSDFIDNVHDFTQILIVR